MLPLTLAPPPPFPLIVAQSADRDRIAPGLSLVTFHLMTSRGPLVVRVLLERAGEPTLRLGAVLADDRLVSQGETISSMALRTHAVAGINADYFDIGQTNQPLGIVVREGFLLRTPSGRAALSVLRNGSLRLGTYRFAGRALDGDRSWQVEGVDEWPPQGAGAVLMRPAFGSLPSKGDVTYAELAPADAQPGGRESYRVVQVARDATPCRECTVLAFGVRAGETQTLPAAGDALQIDAALDPPIGDVETALGGGPLLVRDGAPYDDPDPPSPQEALQRDPQSGAFAARDGSVGLVEVDGRRADFSTGLVRGEFGALLLALGAVQGMAFDSGGSATLVARLPGDATPSLISLPSDGRERRVADGLFIYSDAPPSRPTGLAVRPGTLRVLRQGQASIRAIPIDAAGHAVPGGAVPLSVSVSPPSLARIIGPGTLLAEEPGSGTLLVRRGSLFGQAPLRVLGTLAGLRVEPRDPTAGRGAGVTLQAVGTDASGAPVAVDGAVRWSAAGGTVSAAGRFAAGASDAVVTARAGGRAASAVVRVGETEAPLQAFATTVAWRFSAFPSGGPGALASASTEAGSPALRLFFDFSSGERAAYANADVPLPGEPLAVSLEVEGDASGAGLRASFSNADGDRVAVTLARRIAWRGWRRCAATLPPTAVPPVVLRSFYVVASLGGPPANVAGSVVLRDIRITYAGSGR